MDRKRFIRILDDQKLPTQEEIRAAYNDFFNLYLDETSQESNLHTNLLEMIYFREIFIVYTSRRHFLRSKKKSTLPFLCSQGSSTLVGTYTNCRIADAISSNRICNRQRRGRCIYNLLESETRQASLNRNFGCFGMSWSFPR